MEESDGCMRMNDKQKFIEDNMSLVYVIVREYYPTFISDEDIIQCGMIGLCKAVNKWEQRGKFSSFARKIILDEIRSELKLRTKRSCETSLESLLEDKQDEYY